MPYAKTKLSTMQRRARQKEGRLRKAGALGPSISDISPVRPWREVQAMTPGEKRSYRAQLAHFTSRQNRLYVYESGEVVLYSQAEKQRTKAEAATAKINERVASARRRINRIKVDPTVSGAGNIKTIEERQRERGLEERDAQGRKTGRVHEYMGSVYGVPEVKVGQPPASDKSAQRRAEALQAMAKRSWGERRAKLRQSAAEMARFAGDDELAERIEKLSDNQFDVLTQRTNFMDELSVAYAPYAGAKSKKEHAVSVATDSQREISTQAEALITVVEQAVGGSEDSES